MTSTDLITGGWGEVSSVGGGKGGHLVGSTDEKGRQPETYTYALFPLAKQGS